MSRLAFGTNVMSAWSALLLAGVCALAAGCASTAQMPPEFNLGNARLVADGAEPALAIDGPSGKGSGAAVGAAKGGGAGFLIGGLACVAAGPLAPLCLAVVVPASAAIGAAGGAVVGAVRADSAENVESKRDLLATTLAMAAVRAGVAIHVQRQLRDSLAVDVPLADSNAVGAGSGWTLVIVLTELSTVGSGPDEPYALQASARLDAMQAAEAAPLFVKHYHALSPTKMTTAQWRVNDAQPTRQALDEMLAMLAAQIVADLTRAGMPAKSATAPA